MIEFGKTLRGAREAAGLTVAQLADKTHMPPSRIEQLEAEDFSKIPAAIYGRGFVRLYCEAVGLDPRPLSAEFTDIFNGRREPEIRERPAAPAPSAAPVGRDDLIAPAPSAPAASVGRDDLIAPPPIAPEPPPAELGRLTRSHGATEPVEPVTSDLFVEPAETEASAQPSVPPCLRVSNSPTQPPAAAPAPSPSLSRYAAPVRETARRSLPPAVWRLAVLGAVAIVVLWLAFLGVRALYRATGGTPADDVAEPAPQSETAAPATPATSATPAAPAAPRTQQKIPELYID